jgi:hypothetical protein
MWNWLGVANAGNPFFCACATHSDAVIECHWRFLCCHLCISLKIHKKRETDLQFPKDGV